MIWVLTWWLWHKLIAQSLMYACETVGKVNRLNANGLMDAKCEGKESRCWNEWMNVAKNNNISMYLNQPISDKNCFANIMYPFWALWIITLKTKQHIYSSKYLLLHFVIESEETMEKTMFFYSTSLYTRSHLRSLSKYGNSETKKDFQQKLFDNSTPFYYIWI